MSNLHDVGPTKGRGSLLIREAGLEDLIAEVLDRVAVASVAIVTKEGRRAHYASGGGVEILGATTWATMCAQRRISESDKAAPFDRGGDAH